MNPSFFLYKYPECILGKFKSNFPPKYGNTADWCERLQIICTAHFMLSGLFPSAHFKIEAAQRIV